MKKTGKGSTIVWIYLIACMVLIQFILPTPLIGMMLPFMAVLDKDSDVKPSQILLPGTMVAFMMQGFAPFGIGTSFWGMFNGYLEAGGSDLTLGILDYAKVLFVPAVIALIYLAVYGWKHYPAQEIDAEMLGRRQEPGSQPEQGPGKSGLHRVCPGSSGNDFSAASSPSTSMCSRRLAWSS